MNVIICVDNCNGVAFNHRRQSRDKVLCQKLIERYKKIKVAPYSEPLFVQGGICVVDGPSGEYRCGRILLYRKADPGRLRGPDR